MTFIVTSSVVASAYYLGMVMTHFTHRPVGKIGYLVALRGWWWYWPGCRLIAISSFQLS